MDCRSIGMRRNWKTVISTRQWTLKQAPRTTRFPDRTCTLRGMFRSPEVGSIGITRTKARIPRSVQFAKRRWLNSQVSTQVRNGVKLGEGDGTVSLLSLGAMCVEGWKRERWNPAGIKVITVEVRVCRSHQRNCTRPESEAATPSAGGNTPPRRGQHE